MKEGAGSVKTGQKGRDAHYMKSTVDVLPTIEDKHFVCRKT